MIVSSMARPARARLPAPVRLRQGLANATVPTPMSSFHCRTTAIPLPFHCYSTALPPSFHCPSIAMSRASNTTVPTPMLAPARAHFAQQAARASKLLMQQRCAVAVGESSVILLHPPSTFIRGFNRDI